MRLYWEVARLAYQRQVTYRTENLAGLFTNVFFGYLRAAVFVAVYRAPLASEAMAPTARSPTPGSRKR